MRFPEPQRTQAIAAADSPSIDAFSRWRVSEPRTLFDSKMLVDDAPLLWDERTDGTGASAHSVANARVRMTTTAAGGQVLRQTFQRFNYQPGKSQLIFMTGRLPQEANTTKRVGYMLVSNANPGVPSDGIYFEVDGTAGASWGIASTSAAGAQSVAQADWNLDRLDGAGPSGITLDLDDVQIWAIDFEWLGVGRVRVGVVVDGLIVYCHQFLNANNGLDAVYMATPNLPCAYQLIQTGAGSGTMDHICSSVLSEGGQEEIGVLRVSEQGTTDIDANSAGTWYAVVGVRLKAAALGCAVKVLRSSVLASTADDFLAGIFLNPTVAGTPTWTDQTNGCTQYGVGDLAGNPSTTTITGGTLLDAVHVTGNTDKSNVLENSIRIGAAIDGTRDELWLAVRPRTNGLDIFGSLTYREIL